MIYLLFSFFLFILIILITIYFRNQIDNIDYKVDIKFKKLEEQNKKDIEELSYLIRLLSDEIKKSKK